jgi:hypothetical protein
LQLAIDNGIPNDFVVHDEVYASDLEVYGWREILKTGFDRGLEPWFTSEGNPSYVLQLKRVEIFFDNRDSASAVVHTTHGMAVANSTRMACNLQYQVVVLDSSGVLIGKDVGDIRYASGNWSRSEMVQGAVERMYEQIARNIFEKWIAQREASPSEAKRAMPQAKDVTLDL